MTQTSDRLVGNSFRVGYRFQRYWDTSMAIAFFSAEVGTGLFVVSLYFNFVLGMIAGLALTATLKPYFHLTHMGVPDKSWRAIIRPDRSWISRGALAIGVLVGSGGLHILDVSMGLLPAGLSSLVGYVALAAGLVVMCYQGFAMAHSESFALWASPLVPLSSFLYSASAGVLLCSLLGEGRLMEGQLATLHQSAPILLILVLAVVVGILVLASKKSKGGAFSVELLMKGQYSSFRNLTLVVGLVAPIALLLAVGTTGVVAVVATLAMLVGFFNFRVLIFKAAVYEPIIDNLAGSLGLPLPR